MPARRPILLCRHLDRDLLPPSCPARGPKRENIRFYATAAAAQQAGFRACLRCRPDATPGSPEWNVRADVVGRAMRLIRDGVVEREGVGGLAGRLGYSARQLNRLVRPRSAPGRSPWPGPGAPDAGPARDDRPPVAHVAFAAGFSSVRQCNDTVRETLPTRRGAAAQAARGRWAGAPAGSRPPAIRLRLPCRRPFNPASVLDFLGVRALPGVESLDGAIYCAACGSPAGTASSHWARRRPRVIWVRPTWRRARPVGLRDLGAAVARCRRLLDLDADPVAVWEALRATRWSARSAA